MVAGGALDEEREEPEVDGGKSETEEGREVQEVFEGEIDLGGRK